MIIDQARVVVVVHQLDQHWFNCDSEAGGTDLPISAGTISK